MDESNLLSQLEELKAHVESLDMEDASRQRIGSLISEIETKIEQPENEEHHHRLTESLGDAVTEFEASHPQLTAIVNRFLMTLADMGI